MAKLYNLARVTTATTGTGTLTLGAAVSGFLTFGGAGASDGDVVAYSIRDGANSEMGTGTYTASGTTLSRSVATSTNSNTAINLSGSAQVVITPAKEDISNLRENNTFTGALNIIPTIAGGSAASSSLVLESTSGTGTTDTIIFKTASQVERMRLTTDGYLDIGGQRTPQAIVLGGVPHVEIADAFGDQFSVIRYVNDVNPVSWYSLKSRGAAVGTNTAVQSGDQLFGMRCSGYDSTGTPVQRMAVEFGAYCDAAPTAGSVAGRFFVSTAASGSATPTEAFRVDSTQRFIQGGTASLAINNGASNTNLAYQMFGLTSANSGMVLGNFDVSAGAPSLNFYGARGAAIGNPTVPNQGDWLGTIYWVGAQQTGTMATQNCAGFIRCIVDGAVTSGAGGDMPGQLIFATTPNASGTPVQRMDIDSGGTVVIGFDGQYTGTRVQIQSQGSQGDGDDQSRFGVWRWTNDANGAGMRGMKSRGTSRGSATVVQNGDILWEFFVEGADGTNPINAGRYKFIVDGTPGTNDMPCRYQIDLTPDGSNTTAECFRISNAGAVYVPKTGTSVNTVNGIIDNGSSPANSILRAASSRKIKTAITDVPQSRIDAIANLKPSEFTSLCAADNKDHRFIGFIAEEVAEIDPALALWGYDDDTDYDEIYTRNGKGEITSISRMPKKDATKKPDGVAYDRILVLQVHALRQRVAELESKLSKLGGK